MRIAIIYGNQRKGSTYNCVKIIKNKMQECGAVEFIEFYLPRDMSNFCLGCFNCFYKGEQSCSHYESINPIVKTIIDSDAIILTSPVYGLNVSGGMKAFIDHLCYLWMPHRPNEEMFSKIGLIISTTAGMGTKATIKTMKKALDFMGVKRILSQGFNVYAASWEKIELKKKDKIEKNLNRLAVRFFNTVQKKDKIFYRISTKVLFYLMRKMISGFEDGNYDKEYWKQKGWLDKSRPF